MELEEVYELGIIARGRRKVNNYSAGIYYERFGVGIREKPGTEVYHASREHMTWE